MQAIKTIKQQTENTSSYFRSYHTTLLGVLHRRTRYEQLSTL